MSRIPENGAADGTENACERREVEIFFCEFIDEHRQIFSGTDADSIAIYFHAFVFDADDQCVDHAICEDRVTAATKRDHRDFMCLCKCPRCFDVIFCEKLCVVLRLAANAPGGFAGKRNEFLEHRRNYRSFLSNMLLISCFY